MKIVVTNLQPHQQSHLANNNSSHMRVKQQQAQQATNSYVNVPVSVPIVYPAQMATATNFVAQRPGYVAIPGAQLQYGPQSPPQPPMYGAQPQFVLPMTPIVATSPNPQLYNARMTVTNTRVPPPNMITNMGVYNRLAAWFAHFEGF